MLDAAAEQGREFGVGDEMEGAGEVVAADLFGPSLEGEEDGGDAVCASGFEGPTAGVEGDVDGRGLVSEALKDLRRISDEREGEGREAGEGGLLGDADDDGSGGLQGCGDGEQERAAACDDDALSANGEAAFDHGLNGSDAHDVGEGPAGEGKEALACAGGEDELVVRKVGGGFVAFGAEGLGLGVIEDGPALKAGDGGGEEAVAPMFGSASVGDVGAGFAELCAPDLAAEVGVVVEEAYAAACLGG